MSDRKTRTISAASIDDNREQSHQRALHPADYTTLIEKIWAK